MTNLKQKLLYSARFLRVVLFMVISLSNYILADTIPNYNIPCEIGDILYDTGWEDTPPNFGHVINPAIE